jgi:SAM-dependent methyltransferase
MGLLRKIIKRPKEPTVDEIRGAVRRKYMEVSRTAEGKFTYPTGSEGARLLGYDPAALREMPGELLESFCGVGNPLGLGPVGEGESLLDVGCGSGFDLIVASRMVGPGGRVCGIDLTPEMAERARGNLKKAGVSNGEVRVAGAEDIPYPSETFHVVTSNGVLNLSPLKEECFREVHRVLRPGGSLQFADIVLKEELPPKVAGSLEAWSD